MWFSACLVLMLATLGWSQMTPMCATASNEPAPVCTLTFNPFMAPQIGPTSTVYQAIMTTYFNVVDCRYCTVENIDANPAPRGSFTTRTTSSILTVTRVGCMPETTAITRRDFRGYEHFEDKQPRSFFVDNMNGETPTVLRRSIEELSAKIPSAVDPDGSQLTVKAYNLIEQLNSAVFAINLISSGFDLAITCQEIRQPTIQIQLSQASLDGQQIGDIICFASVYGIDLNSSTAEVLKDLEAAIYAIEIGSNFPDDTQHLCSILDLSFGHYLGIDVDAIYQFICGPNYTVTATPSVANTSETSTATVFLGTGSVGTGISAGSLLSGEAGPYANLTMATTTDVGTAVGTIVASGDAGMVLSNATSSNDHLPPSPTASPYYPVWVTSTTAAAEFMRY